MTTRRHLMTGAGAALVATATLGRAGARAAGEPAAKDWAAGLADAFARLERGIGGRLGVAVLDTGNGARASHRGAERFAMCSTFKWLAAAAVLARVDAGKERLDRRVRFERADLVPYSPATEKRAGTDDMTVAEICEAAVTLSDNTAGNLMLASLGGPAGLTAFARAVGDPVSRLDRIEPTLNEARPGDPRDTTTPDAMAANLAALVLGTKLSPASRERLAAWLVASKTGDARVRAGLPKDWRVGDKTGTGREGTFHDVAVAWPPGRAPLVLSVYVAETKAGLDRANATVAGVARAVAGSFER